MQPSTSYNSHKRIRTNEHVSAKTAQQSDHLHPRKKRRIDTAPIKRKTARKPRLPRPKTPLTFSLPKHLTEEPSTPTTPEPRTLQSLKNGRSRSSTPTNNNTSSPETPLLRLNRINILLTSIHRRNKNQHRNQPFYRHFSSLRRSTSKLIRLYEESSALSSTTATDAQVNTAASVRSRFERESLLRSQREILESHIRETVVPASYAAFSAVVADTQFANLGVVLLGVLADVVGVVGLMRKVERRDVRVGVESKKGVGIVDGRLTGLSMLVTGPDQGVVVQRVYDSDNQLGTVAEVGVGEEGVDARQFEGDDVGEVVQREEIDQVEAARSEHVAAKQATVLRKQQDGSVGSLDLDINARREQDDLEDAGIAQSGKEPSPAKSTDKSRSLEHDHIPSPDALAHHTKSQRVRPQTTSLESGSERSDLLAQISRTRPPLSIGPSTTGSAATVPSSKRSNLSQNSKATRAISKYDTQEQESKGKKKKRKKNAIDDLFNGFG